MTTTATLDAVVVEAAAPANLDGGRATAFRVRTAGGTTPETVRVFLPVEHAELVDEVSLQPGSELRIAGRFLAGDAFVATGLTALPAGTVGPGGRLVGTVQLPIPPSAMPGPDRARRDRWVLRGGLAVVVVLGLAGMLTDDNRIGVPAFLVFVALCGWLVVSDLRGRKVDGRGFDALARSAEQRIRTELGVTAPRDALLTMLGAGLERTGNPWRPTRPRRPQPVAWGNDQDGVFRAMVTPVPLQPGSTATITIAVPATRY